MTNASAQLQQRAARRRARRIDFLFDPAAVTQVLTGLPHLAAVLGDPYGEGKLATNLPGARKSARELYRVLGNTHYAHLAQPAGEISHVFVMNVDDSRKFFDRYSWGNRGDPTFRVPPGTYSVTGWIRTEGQEEVVTIGEPQFEVAEDTTVVLDARESSPYVIETGQDTVPRTVSLAHYRQPVRGPSLISRFHFSSTQFEWRFFAAPTDPITKGAYEHYSRWELIDPESPRRPPAFYGVSPFLYDLILPEPGRIPESLHYEVGAEDVATLPTDYHAHILNHRTLEARHFWRPYETSAFALGVDIVFPQERVEFVSAGNLVRQSVSFTFPFTARMFEPITRYRGGERIPRTWFKQPARPGTVEGTEAHPGNPSFREPSGNLLHGHARHRRQGAPPGVA